MRRLYLKSTMITAHAGCEGTGLDTMDSIHKALELHADAAEIDVRMDPLGSLRISHDPLSIEDYLKKNPLEDVFNVLRDTSMLINFEVKEPRVFPKTLEAAEAQGFPTERLIFSGRLGPGHLSGDKRYMDSAAFFLNIEEVLKYVFVQRKAELGWKLFSILIRDPYVLLIEEGAALPDPYIFRAKTIQRKLSAVSKMIREIMIEETARIYVSFHAAAANIPKFLLGLPSIGYLRTEKVPLSVWTVDSPEVLRLCMAAEVYNITTRSVSLAKQVRTDYIREAAAGHSLPIGEGGDDLPAVSSVG